MLDEEQRGKQVIPTREQIEEHGRWVPAVAFSWLHSMRDEIGKLTDVHDAALAENAKLRNNFRAEIDRLHARTFDIDDPRGDIAVLAADFDSMQHDNISRKADAVRLQSELDMTNAQLAKARDALAKATTAPSEGEIAAWERNALFDQSVSVNPSGEPSEYDVLSVHRKQITAGVALMRRAATDPDAKLRELREHLLAKRGFAVDGTTIVAIDRLLAAPAKPAEPAPNHFEERASELRAMLSWVEYQPCLRSSVAAKAVKLYLKDQISNLDEQAGALVKQSAEPVPAKYSRAAEVRAWDDRISAQFGAIAKLVEYGSTKDAIDLCHSGRVMCEEARDKILACMAESAPADDTRELVAQLADAVVEMCDGQGFGGTLSEVQAIAAQLREGK